MIKAQKFIYYSTILAIFSAAFVYNIGTFQFQLFYIIMGINLCLMLLMRKLWLPRGLVIFLGFLLFSGALGIARHTDTVMRVAKETIGVGVCAFYSCCFFNVIDFHLEESFRLYAKMAYWMQVIGLIFYPFQYFFIGKDRYRGLMNESSYIALLALPALYYYADRWQRERTHGREIIVLLIAFAVAQSSTGFTGLLIALGIFLFRYRRLRVLLPVFMFLGCWAIYSTSDLFAERFDDTYKTFSTQEIGDTNLSTYVLYTNFFVMEKVLQEHPILGNGFGSHGASFGRYIGSLDTGPYAGADNELWNAEDASSLGIRVLSDMGLLGAFLALGFIWHLRPGGTSELDVMRQAILIYFCVKILRGGLYFQTEQYYYICFYAFAPMVLRQRAAVARAESLQLLSESPVYT